MVTKQRTPALLVLTGIVIALMGLALVIGGALLLTGCVWAIGRGVPLACRGIRTLWNKLSGKAGARSHA